MGLIRRSTTRVEELEVSNNVLVKKPSVKAEANAFYTFIDYCDGVKHELIDKTFERTDAIYNWFWQLRLVAWCSTHYYRWEKKFIIGTILQVIKCCLNTRSVLLLPFFPVGIVFYKRDNDILAVVFLFLALMYFAKVLSNTTEWASEHFGPVIGSLLNSTFGNLVELIISGTTVSKDDATLTITSLIGSIISNNLFVTGSCAVFGGMEGAPLVNKKSITSHIVFFMCVSLLFCMMCGIERLGGFNPSIQFKMNISQVCASFVFVNYLVYLVLSTNEEFGKLKKKDGELDKAESEQDEEEEEEESEDLPPKIVCFGALAVAIAGLGPTANFFVESLKKLTDNKPISKVFIGLIILPLAGSLPEHLSSVSSAYRGDTDLAVNLSVGSSNQVIGFVLPIIQFISSKYPKTGLTLFFEPFIAVFLAVTALMSSICLVHALIFNLNIFHSVLLISTFVLVTILTFIAK